MKEFNINEFVKVKLTHYGLMILRGYYDELYGKTHDERFLDYSIKQDESGYISFQMHELMRIFGQYLYVGNVNTPFEGNRILIDDQYLIEPKEEAKKPRTL